jgi:D-glycero-alpha-D-manno-heptose-7-phosphate kinase
VSFVGGGSDVPAFYEQFGEGNVLSASIEKYIYVLGVRNFRGSGYSLRYSKVETVNEIDEIAHPIIREVVRKFEIGGLELSVVSEIPAGTGLGSSSAFTCAMIAFASEFTKSNLSQRQIADLACEIELDVLKEPIGKQDQYGSAIGGLKHIRFSDSSVEINRIFLGREQRLALENRLKLVYLGLPTRSAGEVLKNQFIGSDDKEKQMQALLKLSKMTKDVAQEAQSRIGAIGESLHAAWELKKLSNPNATSPQVEIGARACLDNGANAIKLLGAGVSGFLLAWSDEGFSHNFTLALESRGLKVLDFGLDLEGVVTL